MDRASTIRFYDHYGHVSAAVCYQNTLHARTGDGRLDHARTHEPRDRKGVNLSKVHFSPERFICSDATYFSLQNRILRQILHHIEQCRHTAREGELQNEGEVFSATKTAFHTRSFA